MKRLHTLFLFLTIAITLIAQPICQVKHFSVSDGLAQGVVMNILQDQKGLIWFSTWNGLNKFDGYTFKTYKTSQESKYAFGSNRMGTISESKYGDIWCPTYDGQACLFDVESEKFIDVLQPIELSTKQTNYVTRIYSLKKGIAWILCENGYAFRVDEQLCKKGEGITLYASSNHNLKGDQIFNVYQDSEEDEWILTDKGVSIIGKKTLDTDFPFQFITQIKESIYLIAEILRRGIASYDKIHEITKIDEWFIETGKTPVIRGRIAHMMNACELSRCGVGVAIYPASITNMAHNAGSCIRRIDHEHNGELTKNL